MKNKIFQLVEHKEVFCHDYIYNFERLADTLFLFRAQFSVDWPVKIALNRINCKPTEFGETLKLRIGAHTCCVIYCTKLRYSPMWARGLKKITRRVLSLSCLLRARFSLRWARCSSTSIARSILSQIRRFNAWFSLTSKSGICHVSVCYARSNNKLMGQLLYLIKPSFYIMDLDATTFINRRCHSYCRTGSTYG